MFSHSAFLLMEWPLGQLDELELFSRSYLHTTHIYLSVSVIGMMLSSVCRSVRPFVRLSAAECVVSKRISVGEINVALMHCRVPRTALPINFFRCFCCRMYRLATKHSKRL